VDQPCHKSPAVAIVYDRAVETASKRPALDDKRHVLGRWCARAIQMTKWIAREFRPPPPPQTTAQTDDNGSEFSWRDHRESVVVPTQMGLAAYWNLDGKVVIRQQQDWDDYDDRMIFVSHQHIPALIRRVETWDYGGHPEFAHLPKDHPFWQEKEDVFQEAVSWCLEANITLPRLLRWGFRFCGRRRKPAIASLWDTEVTRGVLEVPKRM
jgi:hypothetical protein